MKEISLNILDIAKNSVKARASLVTILLEESEDKLTLIIEDDGCGMKEDTLRGVCDPFYTTRTTRKVGLGIPLLKLSCEQTEGSFHIESRDEETYPDSHGTKVTAVFNKKHIDFTPLGDVAGSIVTLIQGDPDMDFLFRHTTPRGEVALDTRELRAQLGDISLAEFEIITWISEYLKEQYEEIENASPTA